VAGPVMTIEPVEVGATRAVVRHWRVRLRHAKRLQPVLRHRVRSYETLVDESFGSMTERGMSAGDGSGPKTRYHLPATARGIVADQPGKMAGEAAIGVVLAPQRIRSLFSAACLEHIEAAPDEP
jgi:hypothetical protein